MQIKFITQENNMNIREKNRRKFLCFVTNADEI